ncbi:phosphotransferase [Novosphingobium cyanobacteriorum]|uniref:Phosphotransferase n=1 Tax=Novosphingobium cyanobacteriorum TaxID=3024215 RepID=A0ABT6CKD7_9SPHN|nr:phosphotransferase [Novosphingobium cyanobacteriorum]MDF8332807.1 phosphotransferase [Novosphingobium cyanobacteriorum]
MTTERDENFCVRSVHGEFVLKVFAPETPGPEADMLCAVLRHLEARAPDLSVPRLAKSAKGEDYVRVAGGNAEERLTVLYTFLPGTPLMDVARSEVQARACGELAGRLGLALRDFAHPAMHRRLIWDLRRVPDLAAIADTLRQVPFADFVLPFMDRFPRDTAPMLETMPRQFVHNDLNARNVIVASDDSQRIAGIIDFGDALHTARVCDVAVGMIGQMASPATAQAMTQAFLDGYQSAVELTPEERAILPRLVAARVVQNVVMTTHYREKNEDSGHFAAFDDKYFAWRVAFAQSLLSQTA